MLLCFVVELTHFCIVSLDVTPFELQLGVKIDVTGMPSKVDCDRIDAVVKGVGTD
jgi:hypothetical protein